MWNWLLTPWLQLLIPVVNSSLSLIGFAWLTTGKMVYHCKFMVALTVAFLKYSCQTVRWHGRDPEMVLNCCCELLWLWAEVLVYNWCEEWWGHRKVFDRDLYACQFNMLFLAGSWILLSFAKQNSPCCGVGNWQPSKHRDVQGIFLVEGFTHVYSYGSYHFGSIFKLFWKLQLWRLQCMSGTETTFGSIFKA